jgi:hypothetical protein
MKDWTEYDKETKKERDRLFEECGYYESYRYRIIRNLDKKDLLTEEEKL